MSTVNELLRRKLTATNFKHKSPTVLPKQWNVKSTTKSKNKNPKICFKNL